jgi:predicted DNA-binding transcriptional regulator AlpA
MMDDDLKKITHIARDMGLSHKTIYNWINDGRLEVKKPGYVSKSEAWEVFDFMQTKRTEISYFLSAYGIKRDSNGRFISSDDSVG